MDKKIIISGLYFLLVILSAGCIKEDLDSCPPVEGDLQYILFKTKNTKVTFEEVVDKLDLYIYNKDKELADRISYTDKELAANGYRAYLPDWVNSGYTVLAILNDNDNFEVADTGSLHTFKTIVIPDEDDLIGNEISDIFLGSQEVSGVTTKASAVDTVYLSKLTNKFYITVTLNGFTLPETREIDVHIQGTNSKYNSQLECIAEQMMRYLPHSRNKQDDTFYEFIIDTLRLWFGDDLTLVVRLEEEGNDSRVMDTLHITSVLAEVTDPNGELLYDSDEKLDIEDEYYLELILDADLKISRIVVNGWFVINRGVNL